MLIWRVINNAVHTLARIKMAIPNEDTLCYLCRKSEESIHHLILKCPVMRLPWWNFPWHSLLDVFQHLQMYEWINTILGNSRVLGIPPEIKARLDRGFANDKYKIRFQEAIDIHLQTI